MDEDSTPARHSLGFRGTFEVGMALFSMFFGAGNLIIAPLLGVQSGPHALAATLGYLVSGVGLPIAAIIALAHAGTAESLLSRIGRRFSRLFTILVYLAIGPALAIPRTASTSFEMAKPLLEGGGSAAVRFAFSAVFFAFALALALRPARIVRLMGKVTGPLLIGLLVLMVLAQILAPAASPLEAAEGAYREAPAVAGFIEGYQTLDLLASFAFGVVVTNSIRSRGIADHKDQAAQVARSGIVAGLLMAAVYGALSYLGCRMGTVLPDAANGAEVLSASADVHFGHAGTVLVAAIFLIACFNVCTGLISSIAQYFSTTFPKLSFRAWAILIAAISCLLSNAGLTAILAFSVPLLMALYPMGICAVAMGLIPGSDSHPLIWRAAMAAIGIQSAASAIRDAICPGLFLPTDMLPASSLGLGWIVPGIAGAAAGALATAIRRRVFPAG